MNDLAHAARQAAIPLEAKKDQLRQTQDGLWKITFTVKQEDMHASLLSAPMGTRYMLAAVQIGDDEQPVKPELSEGEKAKRHFEAMCQDGAFKAWLSDRWAEIREPHAEWPGEREIAKHLMGILSANELVKHPDPWKALYTEFQYRDAIR